MILPSYTTHTHTQESKITMLLRIYVVENIMGKFQSSTFKSLHLLEMKIYLIKWLKNVCHYILGTEHSICQFILLCVPDETMCLQSWYANPQQAALTPLTKYHHGLVAAALVPSQYTASTGALHTQPAPQIINHMLSWDREGAKHCSTVACVNDILKH